MHFQDIDPKEFLDKLEELKTQLDEQKRLLEASQNREQELIEELKKIKDGDVACSSKSQSETLPFTSATATQCQVDLSGASSSTQANKVGDNLQKDDDVSIPEQEQVQKKSSSKPLINKYSHPQQSGLPAKWIQRYEKATNDVFWDEDKKLNNLPLYLEDQAQKWVNHTNFASWAAFKVAFVEHFQSTSRERTDFYTTTYDKSRHSTILQFIEEKESKALAAGIDDLTAIENTVLCSRLPQKHQDILACLMPKTWSDLKESVSRTQYISLQYQSQLQLPSTSNQSNQFNKRPYFGNRYIPAKHFKPFNQNRKPQPTDYCKICFKRKGKKLYHWLSDCFFYRPKEESKQTIPKAVHVMHPQVRDQDPNQEQSLN